MVRAQAVFGKLVWIALPILFAPSIAQAGRIVGWGEDHYDGAILSEIPLGEDFVAIDAGGANAVALKVDGSLASWGYDGGTLRNPPPGNDFVAIASGNRYNLALRRDGSIAAWGMNFNSILTTVPQGNNFVAISAGSSHAVALTDEGMIVVWGSDYWGQHAASGATDIQAIAATGLGTIAIKKSTGSLLVWDEYPDPDPADDLRLVPSGRMVALSVGNHALAQRTDGTIVGWGPNDWGEADSVDGSDFASFSAGGDFSLALRNDGSLFAWGHNDLGQCDVPSGNNFTAASAGGGFGLAIQVPEPSTWALLLTSLPAGLVLWRRRRWGVETRTQPVGGR